MCLSVYLCVYSTLTLSFTPPATTALLTVIKPQYEQTVPMAAIFVLYVMQKDNFKVLRPSSNFTERHVPCSAVLRSAHTVYLCVLCGYENKERLFPYTALTDWFFITETECVYCAVRTESTCNVY